MPTREIEPPVFPDLSDLMREWGLEKEFVHGWLGFLSYMEVEEGVSWVDWLRNEYNRESQNNSRRVGADGENRDEVDPAYPSQGLVVTGCEPVDLLEAEIVEISEDAFQETIEKWLYYLALFNHPERLEYFDQADRQEYQPPPRVLIHPILAMARLLRMVVAIDDLGMHITGADKERKSRTNRFREGPFVNLGRQARMPFVGSANTEIFGTAPAVASLAQAHCLGSLSRDGFFKDMRRQADLAVKVFEWIERSPLLPLIEKHFGEEAVEVWKGRWRRNVMGVLEADPQKALDRAIALYQVGVRTFRIYSPEPGTGPLETLKLLRKEFGEEIEIFAGQVVSVKQALELQDAGANGIFVGIGGGGRCTTGVRANAVIDWPQLVWDMVRRWRIGRRLKIPIIVEGGASDHIAQTWAVGGTGIGVARAVGGGTIESPGGRFFMRLRNILFKFYGGEAAARVKVMGGQSLSYIEGETAMAKMNYKRGEWPTILHRLFLLNGDAIMSLVFQNVRTIWEFQKQAIRTLRWSPFGAEKKQRNTH